MVAPNEISVPQLLRRIGTQDCMPLADPAFGGPVGKVSFRITRPSPGRRRAVRRDTFRRGKPILVTPRRQMLLRHHA